MPKKDERLCAVSTTVQIFGTETAANVALMERAAEQRTDECLCCPVSRRKLWLIFTVSIVTILQIHIA